MLPLLVACPAPALQRMLRFPTWDAPGDVVRSAGAEWSVGGKGTNAARAIVRDGGAATLIAFAGGPNGERMRLLLREESFSSECVEIATETRVCQTLLDGSGRRIRELVEDAGPVSPGEWAEFYAACERALPFHGALLLCGSLPAASPDAAYAGLIRMARDLNKPVLIDARGAPLLAALPERPNWVKINRTELLATTGHAEVESALRALADAGAVGALITDGPGPAWLLHGGAITEFILPSIDAVNPIGGGDTVAGVFMNRMRTGSAPREAARAALGAALAQTLTTRPAEFYPAQAAALAAAVQIR